MLVEWKEYQNECLTHGIFCYRETWIIIDHCTIMEISNVIRVKREIGAIALLKALFHGKTLNYLEVNRKLLFQTNSAKGSYDFYEKTCLLCSLYDYSVRRTY